MIGFLGEVKLFAGTYAPRGWAFCDGQLLPVQDYQALYSLLGVQYGGDGRTTFGVPDFRGRVPIGTGYGPGLTPRIQGQFSGYEKIQLSLNNIPIHTHEVACDMKTGSRSVVANPDNNIPANKSQGEAYGDDLTGNTYMHPDMLTSAGGSYPHENMQPWGCLHYIICIEGNYPPRN